MRGKPGRPTDWPRLLAQAGALRDIGWTDLAAKLDAIARGEDAAEVFGQIKGTPGRRNNGWVNTTRAWVYLSLVNSGTPEPDAMDRALAYLPDERPIQAETLLRFIRGHCPKCWPVRK